MVLRFCWASQDLNPGDRIIQVPEHCQLNYATATDPKLRALMERVPVSEAGRPAWQFKMALLLVWHRLQGGDSAIDPYLQHLPGMAPGRWIERWMP